MKNILIILLCIVFTADCVGQIVDSEKDGKYYMVNGARIWTVSVGKGEPILAIAGGPGDFHIGLRSYDSLSTTNRMVYFDGFGRGKSDTAKNPKEYSLQRDIEDLEALRKAMGFDKIAVLGHSYGTVVAQGYALAYGQHVSRLILVAPFHSNTMWQENDDSYNHGIRTNFPEIWDTLMTVRKQGFRSADSLHQAIYGRVPIGFFYMYNPENLGRNRSGSRYSNYPNRFNTRLYYQMVGNDGDFVVGGDIGRFDYRQQLNTLKMPVLILAGRYDKVSVPWMAAQYKQYCPQAQFVLFEKSGHAPQVEEPEKAFRLMREFLSR